MKAHALTAFVLAISLCNIQTSMACNKIKFNPEVGQTVFAHQPQPPYVSVGEDEDDALDTYQGCSVTLRARYNADYGTSGGTYHRTISSDGGQTWAAWTSKPFYSPAPTITVEWKKGNSTITGNSRNQSYTIADSTATETCQFSMAAKFTTQGDATYLEERILANADQATATSDSSASSELRAYVTSDPFPTTFPQNTLRCWREPGETQWKLYKCTVANSAHWNFEENLPAGRP